MVAKHTQHVALSEQLKSFVEQRVADGRYRSASAVVQAALKLLMESEKAMEPGHRRSETVRQKTGAR